MVTPSNVTETDPRSILRAAEAGTRHEHAASPLLEARGADAQPHACHLRRAA